MEICLQLGIGTLNFFLSISVCQFMFCLTVISLCFVQLCRSTAVEKVLEVALCLLEPLPEKRLTATPAIALLEALVPGLWLQTVMYTTITCQWTQLRHGHGHGAGHGHGRSSGSPPMSRATAAPAPVLATKKEKRSGAIKAKIAVASGFAVYGMTSMHLSSAIPASPRQRTNESR